MPTNTVTPWSFRDGRDYIFSLSVNENNTSNPSMSLKLLDKITAEEWTCAYDAKYIETLTQRTGNFKPFNVFISMITAALVKKSDSVTLELVNFEDLEKIRVEKGVSVASVRSSLNGHSHVFGDAKQSQAEIAFNSPSKKRYLIVIYVAEFDKVQYPIPLNYSGAPNPQIMQENIIQLRSEVTALRNAKDSLEDEVLSLRKANGLSTTLPRHLEINSNFNGVSAHPREQQMRAHPVRSCGDVEVPVPRMETRFPEDAHGILKELKSKVQYLEEKLHIERIEHQDITNKLQDENDLLRQKLQASETYEQSLEAEIFDLRNIASSGPNLVGDSYPRPNDNPQGILTGSKKLIGTSRTRIRGTNGFYGPGRIRSPYASPFVNRRSRSYSPSPLRNRKPPFDPTAYIQEKKRKQEQLAQMRLEKIKNKLQLRDVSPSSSIEGRTSGGSRSRSRSEDSASRSSKPPIMTGQLTRSRNILPPHPGNRGMINNTRTVSSKPKAINYGETVARVGRERYRNAFDNPHKRRTFTPSRSPEVNRKGVNIPLHTRINNLVNREVPEIGRRESKPTLFDSASEGKQENDFASYLNQKYSSLNRRPLK